MSEADIKEIDQHLAELLIRKQMLIDKQEKEKQQQQIPKTTEQDDALRRFMESFAKQTSQPVIVNETVNKRDAAIEVHKQLRRSNNLAYLLALIPLITILTAIVYYNISLIICAIFCSFSAIVAIRNKRYMKDLECKYAITPSMSIFEKMAHIRVNRGV